jgi:hypothetical protein
MKAARVKPVKKVAVRVVDGKAVMLTVADSKLHRLNTTATRIWEGIMDGMSSDEIVDALCTTYAVPRETAQADVEALLRDLLARGIVSPVDEAEPEEKR